LFTNCVISKKKKTKQTYIERSSFQCASYLQVNWPSCEGTPPLCYGTTLEEAASQVAVGASSWSASKDTSTSLLEELAANICSWRAVYFVLHIYTNLMNNYIIKFDYLKKNRQHLPYNGDYLNFLNLQILTIYMPQTSWFYFIYTRNFIF
jgi:hypothetical protein